MKATQKQRDEVRETFNNFLNKIYQDMMDFRNNLCDITLINTDVKYHHDYKEFGKEAFIYKLKTILEDYEVHKSIMKQVEELINDKYQ